MCMFIQNGNILVIFMFEVNNFTQYEKIKAFISYLLVYLKL
jgi:hypothetical protein